MATPVYSVLLVSVTDPMGAGWIESGFDPAFVYVIHTISVTDNGNGVPSTFVLKRVPGSGPPAQVIMAGGSTDTNGVETVLLTGRWVFFGDDQLLGGSNGGYDWYISGYKLALP